ncbi:hypothetical protein BBG47_20245 [Paenibacillus sp. KS1]|uniref:SHOCT domain-containing protein n=1 Tax=Paenibacillus sp. KS1 TaxID=1849249 RepID=UPI0008064F39|nr:SHOCT domain-containing protein [Paenibacillus sp. KS1]OBY77749.1 hypothetical protein BBG47_20245 [Paenibacillus sp. KS1]
MVGLLKFTFIFTLPISIVCLLLLFFGNHHDVPFSFYVITFASVLIPIFSRFKWRQLEAAEIDNNRTITTTVLNRAPEFRASHHFESVGAEMSLLVDEKQQQICFCHKNSFRPQIYNYRDIVKSELLLDENNISTMHRDHCGHDNGGGHSLLGYRCNRRIKKIELSIIVDDMYQPVYKIKFLNDGYGLLEDESEYKRAFEEAYQCHQLINVLMKRGLDSVKPNETVKSTGTTTVIEPTSAVLVADELRKLSQLKDEGVISQEEFDVQKKKLIG